MNVKPDQNSTTDNWRAAFDAAIRRIAGRLLVTPCGDDRFGVYLHGSNDSYIILGGPCTEDQAKLWRESIMTEIERALQ
jgi:hypothetical protein